MKFKFILIILLSLSIQSYSQSKSNISAVYGTTLTDVDIHRTVGDFAYNIKTGIIFGFTYTRSINKLISLQTGLLFVNDKTEINSILPGARPLTDGNIKMISVPLIAKFTFFKHFYADAGTSIDMETNYSGNSIANNQSGLGFELGIGGQYTLHHVTIFINPYYKAYDEVRFNSQANYNLLELGVKCGIGYNF